jgi:D-alanyl-lipoteichoic acid acyltransferase DltB (MBOAT superfamily)
VIIPLLFVPRHTVNICYNILFDNLTVMGLWHWSRYWYLSAIFHRVLRERGRDENDLKLRMRLWERGLDENDLNLQMGEGPR